MFTSFVGGSQYVENALLDEEKIKDAVWKELKGLYAIKSKQPLMQSSYLWKESIPQYDSNIRGLKEKINLLKEKNIHICANWYEGISLPACIKKAKTLALEL